MQIIIEQLGDKLIQLGLKVVFAVVCLIIGMKLIKWVRKITKKCLLKANADTGLVQFLDAFIKFSLMILLIAGLATSFGVQVASIVAVLGSAGVTLGLALQGSLSNFAGGVLILILKPFKVGDYIVEDVNKNEGVVSEISLFYTKLRTTDERIVVLPNGNLANNSLTNVTESKHRRLDLKIGVSYESDIQKVKNVLMELISQEDGILKDKQMMVYVDELADSAVIMGMRCYVLQSEYWTVKWRVLENILMEFDKNGIEIPYPKMDVQIRS